MSCSDCQGPLSEHNTTGRCHRCLAKPWTEYETDRLADYIADGWTFGGAARALRRTRNSCISRFRVIAKQFGWQSA